MGVFYLIWSLIGAVFTWNVFRPLRWSDNSAFVFFTFVAGWLIGDLALHWILINLAIALFFVWSGVLESGVGQGALVVNLLGWVFLARRFRSLFRLGTQAQQQMKVALGADYEAHISKEFQLNPSPAFRWKHYWNPSSLPKDSPIEIISNLPFHEERGCLLQLDIYRPRELQQNHPVLLQIHGGAWSMGTKDQGIPLMVQMAAQGWICFAITYRLSPQAVFPAHLIDCKRAVHWIKQNGVDYGADPNFIVVTGGSSGGHLAALTALTAGRVEFQPGFEKADTGVQGCVAFYGIYDCEAPFQSPLNRPLANLLKKVMDTTPHIQPQKYRNASPIHQITKTPPPFMVIQGEADALVPAKEAVQFHQALQNANAPDLVLLKLPGVGHGFDHLPTIPTQKILPAVAQYLSLLRSKRSGDFRIKSE